MTIISAKPPREERLLQLGSNKFELVDFRLWDWFDGSDPNGPPDYEGIYGINIAKVREINKLTTFTKMPNCHECIEGVLEIRDEAVPVINLSKFLGFHYNKPRVGDNVIICEFNHLVTGFTCNQATRIRRISWKDILPPTRLTGREGGCVTGMHKLDGERMLLILDFERIVAEINGDATLLHRFELDKAQNLGGGSHLPGQKCVLVVDDSSTARAQVEMHLSHQGFHVITACDGEDGFNQLLGLWDVAQKEKKNILECIQMVVTDVEMPRVDGYTFIQNMKKDTRFNTIPVILNTSLSGRSVQMQGKSLADDYVVKFNPEELVKAVHRLHAVAVQRLQDETSRVA